MADHPLRPATDHRLGEPLPHQLPNPTRAPPSATSLSSVARAYAVLASVSRGYPPPMGRFPRVTHPCATNGRSHPFDLHVLGMPPAFVLSQDQTLRFNPRATPLPRKTRARSYLRVSFNKMRKQQLTQTPPPAHPFQFFQRCQRYACRRGQVARGKGAAYTTRSPACQHEVRNISTMRRSNSAAMAKH